MKNWVGTYTTISETTSKLVRRQLIIQAETREEATAKAIAELSEEGHAFKLNSVKQWDIDNLAQKQTHIDDVLTATANKKK